MVNIAGYEIKLGSAGIINTLLSFFWGFMIILIVGIIGFFVYKKYKNKTFFTNPITLTMYYENGTKKRKTGLRGGKFINNAGIWDFKIQIPKQRKKKELGYMPDFSKADNDGTLHFITSGDGTIWLQVIEKLNNCGKEQARGSDGKLLFNDNNTPIMIDSYELLIQPVRTDVKQATVNSLKNWREMISKNKLTAFGIAIGAFLIMVIAHLISLYIQTKIKCPVCPV